MALLWVLEPACVGSPHQAHPSWQREMDRNQELLARIRQLQEREAEAEEKMKEQLERHKLCQQSLDAAGRKLREKEDGLAEAGEVRGRGGGAASREEWSGPAPAVAAD